MLYLGIYLLVAIVILIQVIQKKQNKFIPILLLSVICIGLILDFALGQDLDSYVFAFERVSTPIADAFKYHIQRNVGFNMLLYFSKQIVNHYAFFRFVTNLIVVVFFLIVIIKNSKNYLLSILLFLGSGIFIVYFGSGIRQMLSMSVFLFAFFEALMKKKYGLYFLLSLLALSFHEAGLIMFLIPLPIFFYKQIIVNYKKVILFGLVMVFISFFLIAIVGPIIYQYVGADTTFTHVLAYFSEPNIDILGIGLRTVLISLEIILFLMIPKEKRNDNDCKMLMIMIFIYFIYLAFSTFSLFARIYDYVAVIELIMIPNFIMKIEVKKYRIIAILGIIGINLFIMFTDIRTLINSVAISRYYSFETLPYISVFDTETIEIIIGDK